MSLPGRLLNVRGTRVFVHQLGTRARGRSPVVLVHGWLLSHYSWRQVIAPLVDAGHEVVALDLPGFGESDRPTVAAYRYDATAFSDTLLDTLDALEIERASLCGHDLGAAVSMVTAARHPDRVDRLALIAPPVYATNLPPEAIAVRLPFAGRFLFRLGLARKMIRSFMEREIYVDPALVTDDWVDYVWERAQRPGGVEAAHQAMRIVYDPDEVAHCVAAVRAPTLIVWGELDALLSLRLGRRLHGELPGSELRVIPGCGHAPAEERPAELLAALVPFLGAREPAAAAPSIRNVP